MLGRVDDEDDEQVRREPRVNLGDCGRAVLRLPLGNASLSPRRLGSVEKSVIGCWRASGWKGKFGHTSGV